MSMTPIHLNLVFTENFENFVNMLLIIVSVLVCRLADPLTLTAFRIIIYSCYF